MAFTLEDGTGIAGANAYVSEAEFNTYMTDGGVDVDDLTSIQITTSIVRATGYIDKRHGRKFLGFKQSKDQGLEWPRLDAFDHNGYTLNLLPEDLKHATMEYALRAAYAAKQELAPDPALPFPTRDTMNVGSTEAAGFVKELSEKVGPIEEKTKLADPRDMSVVLNGTNTVAGFYIPAYPAADMLIGKLLRSNQTLDMERA